MDEIRSAELPAAIEVVTAVLGETDLDHPQVFSMALEHNLRGVDAWPLLSGLMALSVLLLARLEERTGVPTADTLQDLALRYGEH